MKLIFDCRVLTHQTYTGVENYAGNILKHIKKRCAIIARPKTANKYVAHLWTHFILPFKKGDVLFCPANIAPVFVPLSKKLVLTIHDVAFLTYPKSFSLLFRIYYRFIVPINVKRAAVIITVSQSSKSEIEKYYTAAIGKIEVIHLGVGCRYKVLPGVKKKKQILYVGSMNERKNFTGILKAFSLMNNSDYKLVMAGNFSSNFALDKNARKLLAVSVRNKNIQFITSVSDDELVRLYNESEVFVFPSFYEGFGLPVLEAMACGTPVVCSNCFSLPEVGKDAVIYCNPNDIEDIKEKIELIINNKMLQTNMIHMGLARAKIFIWEKSADRHLELFDQLYCKR